jgi:hypothetical protein
LRAATVAVVVLAALALPAAASDKYEINESVGLDAARRPAPGKALVYFARTQLMGAAVKVKLFADGEFVGLIQSKTFIPYECDPGKHEFIVVAENAGFLEAELLPDRIYVVQVAIHMGAMKARTHFEVARKGSEALDEFSKAKDKLHAITTTAEGRKWVEEDAADDAKKIKKYRDKGEEFETLKPEDGGEAMP